MEETLLAIDPEGCGCTECLVGIYVPVEAATEEHIVDLLAGRIADNSGSSWRVGSLPGALVEVVHEDSGRHWKVGISLEVAALAFDDDGRARMDSAACLVRFRRRRY